MAHAHKVLLADPDVAEVRALTKVLRQRGFHVQYASDGSKALEVAVLRHPDVILIDENCKLIEPRAFVRIVGSNPRTEDIPVVLTSRTIDVERHRVFREGVLRKPFNLDDVIARIEHLCRRADAARELRGDAREIAGGLAQLPISDLLQILSMNRRTGKLLLTNGQDRGEIQLSNGRPANARSGEIEGEKAFFRLVGWTEGSFAFSPGPAPLRPRIDRAMDEALLEGMRQTDERARLLATLPPLNQLMVVSPSDAELVEPHPVTAEVIRALEQPRRLWEVLDWVDAPDLEVLSALKALIDRQVIQPHEGAVALDGPLLSPAESHALRSRFLRNHGTRQVRAKIIVCGTGPKSGRWLLRSLPGLASSTAEPSCLRSHFGTLGALTLSPDLALEFVLLPTAEAARPLWRPFCAGAVGALVLEDAESVLKLARFAAYEMRLPAVVAAKTASNGGVVADVVPAALRGAPNGVAIVSSDISAAVRSLLVSAISAPTTELTESGIRPRPGAY